MYATYYFINLITINNYWCYSVIGVYYVKIGDNSYENRVLTHST